MPENVDLPSVIKGCVPREDILKGTHKLESFAANLTQVAGDKGPEVYTNPEKFFENTYPTEGLKTTIKEVFGRLVGSFEGTPVIQLETGLGGGKTHTLIALYHLAKHGSEIKGAQRFVGDLKIEPMHVVALVGTELEVGSSGNGPKTLWGEMAVQLKGKEGYDLVASSDKNMTSPGERVLRKLFGDDKCLILIDELALYLTKASAVPIGKTGSNLGEQTVAFIQELTQVAASLNNVELVITALEDESVFKRKTKDIKELLEQAPLEEEVKKNIKDGREVMSRLVRTLEPTKGEEFAHIIRHRLFERIDETIRDRVVDAYLQGFRSELVKGYLPSITQDPEYREIMQKSYPFHPEVIDILRTKISSVENFNRTRGVLRLLSILLAHVWKIKIQEPLIHPFHFDFYNNNIRNELINRLDMTELNPAIEEDLANKDKKTRAEIVDEGYSKPYGSRITSVVLLHSLTQKLKADSHKGANSAEIHLALWEPGQDPEIINKALEDLNDTWFYFGPEGQYYVAGLNPRLNKIIEKAKEQIEQTKINQEVENWIRKVFHSKTYFKSVFFPSSPASVNDDTNDIKLVVMHYNDCQQKHGSSKIPELVRKIFSEAGSQGKPRSYINNLVFLVADEERIKQMETQARSYLALRQLIQDYESGASYLSALTKEQKQKLKNQRNETELYLKIAVTIAYKHLIVPTTQGSLTDTGQRPLRVMSMRDTERDIEDRLKEGREAEDSLVAFLRDRDVARTADDPPLSPARILDGMWKKTADSMDGDEFKKMFYKNPIAGIHFSDELIRKSMKEGVKRGIWYAVVGDNFYDKENWQSFNPSFTSETIIALADSQTGRELVERFYCPKCGKKKTECICGEKPLEEDICPICGKKKDECTCGLPPSDRLSFSKSEVTLERVTAEINAWIADNNISSVSAVKFEALSRDGLSALSKALKQFRTKIEVRYDIEGKISRPEKQLVFEIRYVGDESGFVKLKSAIFDFMPTEDFDFRRLLVHVSFTEPYDAAKLAQDIGERIADFTMGNAYDVTVTAAEES